MKVTRRFVPTAHGAVHVALCGIGHPVLLLHQTPRSWDEYRDVLPLLARRFWAIAVDTPGFGDSEPLANPSIETWAVTIFRVLDALEIHRVVLVGHHTGAAIAMEMAVSRPHQAAALVLSSCPMVDAARRAASAGHPVIDAVEHRADGSHLTELWGRRAPYYPDGNVDLLNRFVADALRAGPLAAEGHRIVNAYRMEDRLPRIACPTLVIDALQDPYAHPAAARLAAAIPRARLHPIPGGMVPLPDQLPHEFSDAILGFLADLQKETQPWTRT